MPPGRRSCAQPPAKKLKVSRSSFSKPPPPPFKILVGKDNTEFYFEKDPLCKESGFFKAACSEQWKSGRTNTVRLEEDDPRIVGIFLTWLSVGSIENAEDLIEIVGIDKKNANTIKFRHESRHRLYDQLVECHILGDILQAKNFQNQVLNSIISLLKESVAEAPSMLLVGTLTSQVVRVFKGTTTGSPLRCFLLQLFMAFTNVEAWLKQATAKPLHDPELEFVQDLLYLSLKNSKRSPAERRHDFQWSHVCEDHENTAGT